jgi:hypothetical protein
MVLEQNFPAPIHLLSLINIMYLLEQIANLFLLALDFGFFPPLISANQTLQALDFHIEDGVPFIEPGIFGFQ